MSYEERISMLIAHVDAGRSVQIVPINGAIIYMTMDEMKQRYTESGSTAGNRFLRPELQNQPKFVGLNGPMYGGVPGLLRYEQPSSFSI